MNRHSMRWLGVVAMLHGFSCTSWTAPLVFQIEAAKSRLEARTSKAGMLSRFGHTHDILVHDFTGTVTVDKEHLERSTLRIEVGTPTMEVVAGELSSRDRDKVQANMVGEDILNVAKFPSITFESTKVRPLESQGPSQRIQVEGKVELHGVTKEMTIPVEIRFDDEKLEARGEFSLLQTDFGIRPFSAMLGSIKVGDEVTVKYSIRAARSAP